MRYQVVRPLVGLMPGFMPARSSDAEDDEQPSQAGLLASGSKRAFVKPSHPVTRVIGVTRGYTDSGFVAETRERSAHQLQ